MTSSMKFFDRPADPPDQRAPTGAAPAIAYRDAAGRRCLAEAGVWRADILPREIARAGSEVADLHRIVATALEHGCGDDVLAVSQRIAGLDPDARRGAVALARTLLACGRTDDAERILQPVLAREGDDAATLTCLARILAARGESALVEDALWRALRADPNHAEAVEWWGRLHLDGMSRIADLPGAWRARLALARAALRNGNRSAALAQYRVALQRSGGHGDALGAIADDLAAQGQHRAVLELVLPAYAADRHHPHVGLVILRACTECDDVDAGRQVLQALATRDGEALRDDLQAYAARFHTTLPPLARVAAPSAPAVAAPAAPVERTPVCLESPVWWAFLRDPAWLSPRRTQARRIVFTGLAGVGDATARAWARAVPLALAEAFAFRTGAEVATVLNVSSPAASAEPSTDDRVAACVRQAGGAVDTVVTGEVVHADGQCRITLVAHDRARGRGARTLVRSGSASAVGAMLRTLEADLASAIELTLGDDPLGLYAAQHPRSLPDRLVALDGLAAMHLAMVGEGSAPALLEAVACIDACARLAQDPQARPLDRLLFLAAIAAVDATGSQAFREHHDLALALVEQDVAGDSAFARAAPLMLWLFDQRRDFRTLRDRVLATSTDAEHRAWLERIGQESPQLVVIGDDI